MARGEELEAARSSLARAVKQAVPALQESVRLGRWNGEGTTLDKPCCGDAAPKLGLMLRHMGYSVNVVEAEFHYYLLYTLPSGQIVIDPTIRQFFKGARGPPSIPQVFVGTIDQLNKLFNDNAAHKGSKYPMSRIYFKDAAVRDERMAELELDWRREDLAPLARFLSAVRHN
jgi:hypothetical protein